MNHDLVGCRGMRATRLDCSTNHRAWISHAKTCADFPPPDRRHRRHPASLLLENPCCLTLSQYSEHQAGGVWYPDSAHKTAQAIKDINHEGLPLIVFANWRGFSGGQRDMFDEVRGP